MLIGRGTGLMYGFKGQLDELTLYDRALSATEIAAIANSPGGKCK